MMQPLTSDELRAFSRAIGRKLTEADLDAREAVLRDEVQRVLAERRANRIPRIQPAEACTELGADVDDPLAAARGVVWAVVAALTLWAAIALALSLFLQP